MTKRVMEKLAPDASRLKLMALVIPGLCIVLLAGLSGCVVEVVPTTPTPGIPGIVLDPVLGPVGTLVTVRGTGWTPGHMVSIYLVTPGQADLPPSGLVSLAVDAVGSFETRLVIPARPPGPQVEAQPVEADWEIPGLALAVARDEESGSSAQALFSLTGPPEAPTPALTLEPSPSPAKSVDRIATTPAVGAPVGATTTQLSVRGGPDTAYPILGGLEAGQSVQITGVSPDGGWWQIRFVGAADGYGWVSTGYIIAENTEDVPIVIPQPVPPTPVPITGWRGEYYNNPDLSGVPVLVRDDPAVHFDWGAGAPAASVAADDFSVRWSRELSLAAGAYRFTVQSDDGVRLWVDGGLVIDEWRDGLTTHSADVQLSEGTHSLRLEYYERAGNAVAQLAWERPDSYPDWKGEYFNNPSLGGVPVLVRNDLGVNFNWGPDSPGPGVPADDFSARWSRKWYFEDGTYRFRVVVDDGARLWVDDELVIDGWRAGEPRGFEGEITLDEGEHGLRLEYFEFRYDAQVQLSWEQVD